MSSVAVLPIIVPLTAALVALFLPRPAYGRRIGVALVLLGLLGYSLWLVDYVRGAGPIVISWGGWIVPYGIVLVADTLAAVMLCLSSLTALACAVFGFAENSLREEHPLRLPLLLLLLTGINLSFLTGDLFNLFVSFEVFLLASYGLMTLEVDRDGARRALSYVTINLIGSALFLCACAFAYALFGTLTFSEIAVRSSEMVGDFRLDLLALLLLAVFSIKAGLFPLYYWLPVSYPTMPAPIGAFYAGMLTKVGVYVLIRVFATVLPPELEWLHTLLAWAAGLTMVIGVLGAVAQNRVQAILSYHIVSQVGYMALAIGLFSPYAFTAAILYIIHHIVVKSTLFCVGGVITRAQGTDDLARTGGLWAAAPALGLVFLVQALSLAGVPPLSGFWGKLMIVREGLSQGEWVLVAMSLVASALTLLSMMKIWLGAFWKPAPEGAVVGFGAPERRATLVVAALAGVSLTIGLGAEHFVSVAQHAANEVLDRSAYVEAVEAINLHPEEGRSP